MLNDHFITLILFSFLVACFFGVLNHRDRRGFLISAAKTMGRMVLGWQRMRGSLKGCDSLKELLWR